MRDRGRGDRSTPPRVGGESSPGAALSFYIAILHCHWRLLAVILRGLLVVIYNLAVIAVIFSQNDSVTPG